MPLQDLGNSQDLVFVENIRDNTVILKGGDLRQVVMVGGINFALKSEEEQNVITQGYQNFLNSLNFPLQIIIHSRKINAEKYLASLEERERSESSGLLQDQMHEYREFIRGFVNDNAIMQKTFLVVVPFSPSNLPGKESFGGMIPFFNKKSAPEQAAQSEQAKETSFQENLSQLKQRVTQVTENLFSIGLETVILNDNQLIELFYNFYNPESTEQKDLPLSGKK